MSPVAATVEAPPAPRAARRFRAQAPTRLFLLPPPPATEPGATPVPASRRPVAELYRLHGPVVYRRCLRLLRNPEAARDATQEVFLRLVREARHLLDRQDLAPWLYRVATNHCLNLRRDARLRGEQALEDAAEPSSDQRIGHLDAILVKRLLARFDDVTQFVAVAVLVDERDHEEVAAALGLSRRTMARKLDRFLEHARRHLVANGDAAAGRH